MLSTMVSLQEAKVNRNTLRANPGPQKAHASMSESGPDQDLQVLRHVGHEYRLATSHEMMPQRCQGYLP